ncbi:MAG: epoxyqueuosine reductase QueH [Clostridia bacterium]|nr:epoxyqueuosine reductase QueH [Clostridia bacterium]
MKINYDEQMTEVLAAAPKDATLLLHSCCAPCSSACLERLFGKIKLTVFYYNPNIGDPAEYEKRKAEQIRFLQETGYADILDCDHDKAAFEKIAQGYEQEPERGKRCYRCYKLRLDQTARVAKEGGFTYFATTLTLSPYKNADWLNELGKEAEKTFGVTYLPTDFKKKNGYLRSIELSKEYHLYRQDYCGCDFSKRSLL